MSENSLNNHALADRFDADWQSGKRPLIGEYLNSTADDGRLNLLKLLLPIEIEYRQNNNEIVVAGDYSELGSQEYELAQDLLAKLANNEQCYAKVFGETRDVGNKRGRGSLFVRRQQ